MEELIFKYLNKELTEKERQQLQDWLELQEENRAIFSKLTSYYKNDESVLSDFKNEVWEDVNRKLSGTNKEGFAPSSSIGWAIILKIAAVLVILSASVLIANQFQTDSQPKSEDVIVGTILKEAPLGMKITTKLPDGSLVYLNSGSKISYPEEFQGQTRKVSLEGEAFFEVKHNPKKPFLVNMGDNEVRVLGTSFNIRSYAIDSAVYVSVASGRVSYSIPSGDEVILEPDRMATYIPSKGSLTTDEVNELQAFGWKSKELYFNDLTLDKVVTELERWYGVEIIYDGLASKGTYSEKFSNPTIKEVLQSLSFVYRFEFTIEGKEITLSELKN